MKLPIERAETAVQGLSYQDKERVLANLLVDIFGEEEGDHTVLNLQKEPRLVDVQVIMSSLLQEFGWDEPEEDEDEPEEEDGTAESGADFGAYSVGANQAIDDLLTSLEEDINRGDVTGAYIMSQFVAGMRLIAGQFPQVADTAVKEGAWSILESKLTEVGATDYDRMDLYGW